MTEYPNSDEEFDLNYGDELDLLCEQDQGFAPDLSRNVRKSLDFSDGPKENHPDAPSFEEDIHQSVGRSPGTNTTIEGVHEGTTKKRPVQELMDEIDGFLSDHNWSRKSKRCRTELELIDYIVEMRNTNSKMSGGFTHVTNKSGGIPPNGIRWDAHNMSKTTPRFPFISIKTHNGERIYVRCHSEDYMRSEMSTITVTDTYVGVMGETFKNTWKEATELVAATLHDTSQMAVEPTHNTSHHPTEVSLENKLWVDLYKPESYVELLSDESTNRTLLKWMKLWDAVVFNRRAKPKVKGTVEAPQNKWNIETNLKVGEDKLPQYKVILLCGPPGLGKTTLAHIVAKHAGYNIVEINASDDRTIDAFKKSLEDATQMRSCIDPHGRPNCLIFDEIDGAPPSSVEYLVKFITGTAPVKGRKGQKHKHKTLKRPIICICNELYVPSLRPLRQIALVINFPPTGSVRLADRLIEISKMQNIKTDLGALLALCDKTENDIRTCLSVLYMYKSTKKLSLTDVHKTNIGLKDKQKQLFEVWREIFQINRKRSGRHSSPGTTGNDFSLKTRMRRVLNTVTSFGDYERLCQGVFENYIQAFDTNSFVEEATSSALEWFTHYDILNSRIQSTQNYTLSGYTPYCFIVWHFAFAKLSNPKLSYPGAGSEARNKLAKFKGIVSEVLKGMSPTSRVYSSWKSLVLDTLPFVTKIITPNFRPVNFHLFTEQEKKDFQKVVSVMIDYNLNYIQERNSDGRYTYNLDPNIEEITDFPGSKLKAKILNSNAYLIAQEIEVEKMRRVHCEETKTTGGGKSDLTNHQQKSKMRETKMRVESVLTKDSASRAPLALRKDDDGGASARMSNNNHIWYSFKEGYSNALRMKIKISTLK